VTILYFIIGFLFFLIVVLIVPVDIQFAYSSHAFTASRTRIRWLFGLITFDVMNEDREFDKDKKKQKVKLEEKKTFRRKVKKRNQRAFKPAIVLAVVGSRGFIRRVTLLIREIITVVEFKRMYCHFSFGLDDPADTGRIYGLLSPAIAFLHLVPRVRFSFNPLFDRVALETEINADVRIVPMKFVLAIFSFLFSIELFRAVHTAFKSR